MRNYETPKNTILIVEDDEVLRDTVRDILEQEGYEVNGAENGRDALFLMRSRMKPSLVLLDLEMPKMNGIEFLRIVNQDDAISSIPILLVSAKANASNSHGLAGYLQKPLDLHTLLARVKNLTENT
ncbi:MAG: response regulator [Cryobacterium sp.]|nr:response regulator [Oligoflexia bacterium]